MKLIAYIQHLKTSDLTKSHGTTKIGPNFRTHNIVVSPNLKFAKDELIKVVHLPKK